MDARLMQMHNFVLTREIIINSIFPVDRMRELNFHRETAVTSMLSPMKTWSPEIDDQDGTPSSMTWLRRMHMVYLRIYVLSL